MSRTHTRHIPYLLHSCYNFIHYLPTKTLTAIYTRLLHSISNLSSPSPNQPLLPSIFTSTITTPPPSSSIMSSPLHLLPSKTAAITGGTTGIGRAIALSFLSHGCNVAVNHLALASDVPHRDSLIAEAAAIKARDALAGELIDVPGDITLPETGKKLVQAAVDRWGRLDVFVSNAGICEFAEFLE
jgi:hypothetical protein